MNIFFTKKLKYLKIFIWKFYINYLNKLMDELHVVSVFACGAKKSKF